MGDDRFVNAVPISELSDTYLVQVMMRYTAD